MFDCTDSRLVTVCGHSHFRIIAILDLRVSETVAHRSSSQVDLRRPGSELLVSLPNPVGYSRDVVPTIALTESVEIIWQVLAVRLEKLLEEVICEQVACP